MPKENFVGWLSSLCEISFHCPLGDEHKQLAGANTKPGPGTLTGFWAGHRPFCYTCRPRTSRNSKNKSTTVRGSCLWHRRVVLLRSTKRFSAVDVSTVNNGLADKDNGLTGPGQYAHAQ